MEINSFFYQVAIIALAGIIIVGFAYYLLKNDIYNYLKMKGAAVQVKQEDSLMPLRLQAYERLILFVERINPTNILIRLHQQGISVTQLQTLVISEINAEFQHNITQQLYISAGTWDVVKKLKDDTVSMISNATKGLQEDSSGIDLSKRVLQHMMTMDKNPYDLTLELIKKDVNQKF